MSSLDVGVHLTLMEERSLTGMRLPSSYVERSGLAVPEGTVPA